MNDSKPFYQSIGVMGPALTLAAWGINRFVPGLAITPAELTPLADGAAVVVTGLLGMYGRWRATRTIR